MFETLAQAITREIHELMDSGVRTAWLSEQNRQAIANAANGPVGVRPAPRPPVQPQPISQPTPFAAPPRPIVPPAPAPAPKAPLIPPVVPQNASWEDLERCFEGCHCCPSAVRNWEYGCRKARVMFIGDFPRSAEALPSTPAGMMLFKMAQAMKLYWENPPSPAFGAYTTDLLKCLPAGRPTPEQISACLPFLRRQIELVAPDALVLLGQLPTKVLTGRQEPFLQLRGSWQTCNGIPAVVIQHPAMILRFQSQPDAFLQERRSAWNTLQELMKFLKIQ